MWLEKYFAVIYRRMLILNVGVTEKWLMVTRIWTCPGRMMLNTPIKSAVLAGVRTTAKVESLICGREKGA